MIIVVSKRHFKQLYAARLMKMFQIDTETSLSVLRCTKCRDCEKVEIYTMWYNRK